MSLQPYMEWKRPLQPPAVSTAPRPLPEAASRNACALQMPALRPQLPEGASHRKFHYKVTRKLPAVHLHYKFGKGGSITHFGNFHLAFLQQLHTLVTSTLIFDDSYTATHIGNSTHTISAEGSHVGALSSHNLRKGLRLQPSKIRTSPDI